MQFQYPTSRLDRKATACRMGRDKASEWRQNEKRSGHPETAIMTTVEIVAAGNELLIGDVLDINTNWLCRGITGLCERMHHTSMVKVESVPHWGQTGSHNGDLRP